MKEPLLSVVKQTAGALSFSGITRLQDQLGIKSLQRLLRIRT